MYVNSLIFFMEMKIKHCGSIKKKCLLSLLLFYLRLGLHTIQEPRLTIPVFLNLSLKQE